jgi:hypothetical protein
MRKALFLVLVVQLAFTSPCDGIPITDLLPDTSHLPALTVVQAPQIYPETELFSMIDGGAEIYMEYGFRQAVNVSYLVKPDDRIDIQLYEMKDEPAALGMIMYTKTAKDSLLGDGFLEFRNPSYAMIQKSNYFAIITWTAIHGNDQMHDELIKSLLYKIPRTHDYPVLVQKAMKYGYSINQIKFLRGKLAVSAIYHFSSSDLFNSDEAICIDDQGTKYLLFQYPNIEQPGEQLDKIREEFSTSTKINGFSNKGSEVGYTDRKNRNIVMRASGNYVIVSIVPENGIPDNQKIVQLVNAN